MGDKLKSTTGMEENEASALGKLLADEYILYMRTRDGSRNIPDTSSAEAQDLLQRQCVSMGWIVAAVSKMVRKCGPAPSFVLEKFMAITRLSRYSERFTSQEEIVTALLSDHKSIMQILRIDDAHHMRIRTSVSTEKFTAELLRQHAEMADALKGSL